MFKHNGSLRSRIVVAVIAAISTLVLAACSSSPAAEPQVIIQTAEPQIVVQTVVVEKVVEKVVVQTVVVERIVTGVDAPPVPKGEITLLGGKIPPVYGGTLRLALSNDDGIKWDSCEFRNTRMLTHSVENFLLGDKRLGPAGTGETTFLPVLSLGTEKIAIGAMADRWDQPDSTTYRFHLRPGIRWQPKFPTNGRLVEVEELVAEFNRIKDCRWPRHDFLDEVTADDTDGDGIADSITYHTNKPIFFWGYEFAWGPYFIAAPQKQ